MKPTGIGSLYQDFRRLRIVWQALSAVTHGIFAVIFMLSGILAMSIVNVFSTLLYIVLLIVSIRGDGREELAVNVTDIAELVIHQVLAVIMVGNTWGFQYYLIIAMIQIMQLNTSRECIRRKSFVAGIVAAIFVTQRFYYFHHDPVHVVSSAISDPASIFITAAAVFGILLYVTQSFRTNRRYSDNLELLIESRTSRIKSMQKHIMYSMADLIEERDTSTGGHVKRTSAYVGIIIDELQENGVFRTELNPRVAAALLAAAPLHDIGKIAISDSILCKEGPLSPEEFETIKSHTIRGCAIVESLLSDVEEAEDIKVAKDVVKYHHERWDGSGYPEGLSGKEIPLAARIMAAADVFDALSSKRAYKTEFTLDDTFTMMEAERGKQFDPDVLDALLASKERVIRVCARQKKELLQK